MRINGPDEVRKSLCEILKRYVPQELSLIEQEKGLQAGSLNSMSVQPGDSGLIPKLIAPHDQPEIPDASFPAILVLANGVPTAQKLEDGFITHPTNPDLDQPVEIFRRTYSLLLPVWVMSQGFEQTSTSRDYLEMALFRVIWKHRQIADNAGVVINSYSTVWEDTLEARDRVLIAGFTTRLQISVDEALATSIDGIADTINVSVSRL